MDQTGDIRERLARLEKGEETDAASMEAMREDLKALRKEMEAMRGAMDAFVNQVKGGTTAIRWAYAVGGAVIVSLGWLTSLAYKVVPGLPIK